MENGTGAEARAYRLRFHKSGLARFISHRDLMRVFQRAFRRAGLPLRLTRGFNPHPKMRIRPAAPLGAALRSAAVEIVLENDMAPDCLGDKVAASLPVGIEIEAANSLPSLKPAPVAHMAWRFPMPEGGALPEGLIPLPGRITWEHEPKGTTLVTIRELGGGQPPGARALALVLAPDGISPSLLRSAELVSIEFEDGV